MTQPTHTPAPWTYDKVITSCGHAFRIGTQEQLDVPHAERKGIPAYACLYVDYGNANLEAEANARLIAAAPELLEALEKSNEQLKMLHEYASYMRRIVHANLKEAEAIKATYIALDDLDDVMLLGKLNEQAIAKARG